MRLFLKKGHQQTNHKGGSKLPIIWIQRRYLRWGSSIFRAGPSSEEGLTANKREAGEKWGRGWNSWGRTDRLTQGLFGGAVGTESLLWGGRSPRQIPSARRRCLGGPCRQTPSAFPSTPAKGALTQRSRDVFYLSWRVCWVTHCPSMSHSIQPGAAVFTLTVNVSFSETLLEKIKKIFQKTQTHRAVDCLPSRPR